MNNCRESSKEKLRIKKFLRNKRSFILVSILCMGIEFAFLSSNLTITGNTSVSGNSWNVYFTNVQVTEDSVEASVVPTTSGTNTTSEIVPKLILLSLKALFLTNLIKLFVSSVSNGQGLYKMNSTANDTNPIYYYRENVDNNNALFAGFCWKIVRTCHLTTSPKATVTDLLWIPMVV